MGVLVSKQSGGTNPFKPNKVSGSKSIAQVAAESSSSTTSTGTSVHLFDFSGSKKSSFKNGGSRRQAWGDKDKDAGKNLL